MAQIYKIQNKIDSKIYIGQTSESLEWRLHSEWIGHFKRAFIENNDKPFYVALRQYGKENFIYEVIEERDNSSFSSRKARISWLNEREKYWIEHYKSYNRDFGYNISHGGRGPSKCSSLNGKKYTLEQKKHVSEGTLKAMQRDDVKVNHAKGLQKAKEEGKLSHNKGRTYVTKGDILRFVFPDEAERLIKEEGFVKGNLISGKTIKQKYKNDPNYRTNVSKGAKKGLAKMTIEEKTKMIQNRSNSIIGRKAITNGIQNKRVKLEELNAYLSSGWRLGITRKEGQQ